MESMWSSTTSPDDQCYIATEVVQLVTRDDQTAPTYLSGGADVTLTCDESDQWLTDNPASTEVILFSDNCDDSEYGCADGFDPNTSGFADEDNVFVCVELVGESTASYTASSCRVLHRTWVATDCFGNQAYHTQVITIEDNTLPEGDGGGSADITLHVNGLCFVDLDPSNAGQGTRPTVTTVIWPERISNLRMPSSTASVQGAMASFARGQPRRRTVAAMPIRLLPCSESTLST